MNPVFVDIHIHTSENPDSLIGDYDVVALLSKVGEISGGGPYLLSLTDHNCVNKSAYQSLLAKTKQVILGAELHILNSPERPAYHCHILFNFPEIKNEDIDQVNHILNSLYPRKVISPEIKDLPNLQDIIRSFDQYDFILLPHGGQKHSTFDISFARDQRFDSAIERSVYYNHFEGFTARNEQGVNETLAYFQRLGIRDFTNLVTGSDNYTPSRYPEPKSSEASVFVPTWMLAEPTFEGLRLSLSESSRLVYSAQKPQAWAEYISGAALLNDSVDISVSFSPGLNVVIGGSSSGKTLLVDSIHNKIKGSFVGSPYLDLGVEDISVTNPSGVIPHYISQNFIVGILSKKDGPTNISEIDIIKRVFPGDTVVAQRINDGLANLRRDLASLIGCVKKVEELERDLTTIPFITCLVKTSPIASNPLRALLPVQDAIDGFTYDPNDYDRHKSNLKEIGGFLKRNEFLKYQGSHVEEISRLLDQAYRFSTFEEKIREKLHSCKETVDSFRSAEDQENHRKDLEFEKLLNSVRALLREKKKFQILIQRMVSYSISAQTKTVRSMGHELSIKYDFSLTKEKVREAMNQYLRSDCQIKDLSSLRPEDLFQEFYTKRPKVRDYDDFESKVFSCFEALNTKLYSITTSDGRDFAALSAGWKTSVLLDLILGYDGDMAPLIIDQPEDNLATTYINRGLIEAIKKTKKAKQVIVVSHNATIPMLGDAQNVILCENAGKLLIRSGPLEGVIRGKAIVDHIAEVTDGGKASIKKRVKKYNLKTFRG